MAARKISKRSTRTGTSTDDVDRLVDAFGAKATRFDSYRALLNVGERAVPALRRGLKDERWEVRRWSAMLLDQFADAEALADLIPLLNDPMPKVRLWAVHSLACDHCKDDVQCPVDVVPLLIERVERDDHRRVRKMALIMLGTDFLDVRAKPVFERILVEESDEKLLLHARRGLDRLAELGG